MRLYYWLLFIGCLLSFKQPAISQDYQILTVDVYAADIAYWKTADRLVVCTYTDTTHGNSVLIINPYTGEIESSTFIGSLPRQLDLSIDEKWAFIGISAANRVVRFDLETLEIDNSVFLGTTQVGSNEIYIPEAIACSPESSDRFALVRSRLDIADVADVVVYDGNVNQHAMGNSIRLKSLCFSPGGQLYGGNGSALHKVNTAGPKITSDIYQFSLGNFNTLQYLNGFLYSQNGYKVDISGEPTLVHEFQIGCTTFGRPILTAPTDSLVFLVGDRANAFGLNCMRITRNFSPYEVVSEFELSPDIEEVLKILTWGSQNVAMKVTFHGDSREKVAIMRPCNYTLGITPVLTHDGSPGACYGELVTLSADTSYSRILWSNGENTHRIHLSFVQTGDYSYQIVDDNGCLSPPSNVLNVDFTSQPDVPRISPDVDTIEICTGEELVLRSSHSGFNENYWDGVRSATFNVDTAGLYVLQVITREGCKQPVFDSIVVVQRPYIAPDQPTISPTNDTSLCYDESITLTGPPGYAEYVWMVLDEEIITDVNTLFLSGEGRGSTPVKLQVFDENGCFSILSDNAFIQFRYPAMAPKITRNATSLTAGGFGPYKWFFNGTELPGITEKTITVSEPGFYQVLNVGICESELSLPFNFE